MSFVENVDKQKEMVFGIHEESITEIFGGPTFDLSPLLASKEELMDASLCGVSREWLPKFGTIAPLVTYGVTVKQVLRPDMFGMSSDQQEYVPAVAVYKQRKLDKEGNQYHVLSFGVSGDVLQGDMRSYMEMHPTLEIKCYSNLMSTRDSLHVAALRHYESHVEICPVGVIYTQDELHRSFSGRFEFLRDGKRKPGYEGAAHIAAVYIIPVAPEMFVDFRHPDYEMIGWFTQEDLLNIATTQQAMEEYRLEDPEAHWAGYADQRTQDRLGKVAMITMEPWSRMLAMDMSGDFAEMLRGTVYHQQL